MHLLYSRMTIGVLYFIGRQPASFANQYVYRKQQTLLLVQIEKKVQQFYSGGACNFRPYFFLLASDIVTTFSLSITRVMVLWDGYYNKAHLQMPCGSVSFQTVIAPFRNKRFIAIQSEILEFSILGCLYFVLLFFFSRVLVNFLNEHE